MIKIPKSSLIAAILSPQMLHQKQEGRRPPPRIYYHNPSPACRLSGYEATPATRQIFSGSKTKQTKCTLAMQCYISIVTDEDSGLQNQHIFRI